MLHTISKVYVFSEVTKIVHVFALKWSDVISSERLDPDLYVKWVINVNQDRSKCPISGTWVRPPGSTSSTSPRPKRQWKLSIVPRQKVVMDVEGLLERRLDQA